MSIYPQGESHQKLFEQLHEASEEIASLKIAVQAFQKMLPAEFLALYNAKWLTSGIHHDDFRRAPGKTAPRILNLLRESGLVEPNPEIAGFWILSEAGKLLIGESEENEEYEAER